MARESQGLQIGLIVCVAFMILFGVLAFIFSKEYGKTKALLADAETKASEASSAQKAAEDENMRLKEYVGHAETATMATIDEEWNNDKLTFGQNYNDADISYRALCRWLFNEVQRKNAELSAEKERVKTLTEDVATLEKTKNELVAKWQEQAETAKAQLEQARADFKTQQAQTLALTKQLETQKDEILNKGRTEIAEKTKEISDKSKAIEQYQGIVKNLNKKIEDMDPVVVEHPDGKIIDVSQSGTVWINRGRADGLALLTDFSVYAKDTTNIAAAGDKKKGAIEVITLIGDHEAEARIKEDVISNPIMPGDLIFTPLWKPGQRVRLALTDGMDLDGDGKSDEKKARNLITMNGGVVDFWLDDEGKSYGQMTTDTRYLVKGKQPDETNSLARINARTAAIRKAEELGMRVLSLDEMLNMMGYVRENRVVHYGSHANPNDFRPEQPEGVVPKYSEQPVSGVFQKREPPRPSRDSAY